MQITNFRFPSTCAKIGGLLPGPLASAPLMLMLEFARRREYLVAPESLYGKSFTMLIEDLGLKLCFSCQQGRFRAASNDSVSDVTLSASALDFFQLASGMEDADTLFFRRRLKMEGDTELGIAVKYWIDASEKPAWLAGFARHINTG